MKQEALIEQLQIRFRVFGRRRSEGIHRPMDKVRKRLQPGIPAQMRREESGNCKLEWRRRS